MPREVNRLSPAKLSAILKARKPGRWGDGAGLWLCIGHNGASSWSLRYQRQGKAHFMGLGPTHTVGLAEAREKARRLRLELLDGIDPLGARRAARVAAKPVVTFGQVMDLYIAAHAPGWRSPSHRRQVRASLESHVLPVLGNKSVAAIDTGDVMAVLEPIWPRITITASRIRERIENILDYATVRGWRQGENVARWRGHLENLLPRASKVAPTKHHPALPYQRVPELITGLRQRQGIASRATEFLVLTWTRSGETRGARWSEMDLGAKTWTIPDNRMKGGKEHRVPLSERCIQILGQMAALREEDDDLIFPGGKGRAPLSDVALTKIAKLAMPGMVFNIHGLRSSARDWAGETTAYPREVVETALAHRLGDKAEQAYARGDLFQKRRRLMDDWARFCAQPAAEGGDVVPLRGPEIAA